MKEQAQIYVFMRLPDGEKRITTAMDMTEDDAFHTGHEYWKKLKKDHAGSYEVALYRRKKDLYYGEIILSSVIETGI